MAEQVITLIYCDPCRADGQETEASPHRVLIDGHLTRIDLCADHDMDLLAPVRFVMEKHGVAVKAGRSGQQQQARGPYAIKPKPDVAPIVCFWCDQTYTTTSGLARHLVTVHGAEATSGGEGTGQVPGLAFVDFYGRTCPWCKAVVEGGSRNLSRHLEAEHPDSPTGWVEAFTAAYRAGDPVGVVAELKRASPLRPAVGT